MDSLEQIRIFDGFTDEQQEAFQVATDEAYSRGLREAPTFNWQGLSFVPIYPIKIVSRRMILINLIKIPFLPFRIVWLMMRLTFVLPFWAFNNNTRIDGYNLNRTDTWRALDQWFPEE